MTTTVTKITGLAEINKILQELPVKVEVQIIRGMLRAATKPIEARAKQLVPIVSADLLNSIKVSTRSRNGAVTATLRAGDKKAFYAHIVEYGSVAHVIKPKKNKKTLLVAGVPVLSVNHPGSKKTPFMRPAMDETQQEAVQAALDYAKKRIFRLKL